MRITLLSINSISQRYVPERNHSCNETARRIIFGCQYDKGALTKGTDMPRPITGTNLSLAALQQIIDSRRSELNRLRRSRNQLQRKLDSLDRQIGKIEGAGGRRGANGRIRNATSLNVTMEQVLRQHGKPMRVGDIVNAVKATGYRSSSANFRGIVNQTLIKDKRFTVADRGVYQLKK